MSGARARPTVSAVFKCVLRARQPVLFSLDAATYPELATKIGAWVLLDLVRGHVRDLA